MDKRRADSAGGDAAANPDMTDRIYGGLLVLPDGTSYAGHWVRAGVKQIPAAVKREPLSDGAFQDWANGALGLVDACVDRFAVAGQRRLTDREMLKACLAAMRESSKAAGCTDWSRFINDLQRHLEGSTDETSTDEMTLRRLLAFAYSGPGELYGDDGELQNSAAIPLIDFRRDSVAEIERKMHERGMRKLAAAGSVLETSTFKDKKHLPNCPCTLMANRNDPMMCTCPPDKASAPLREKCPKCGNLMFNWPDKMTKCTKCLHEWYMDSSQNGTTESR